MRKVFILDTGVNKDSISDLDVKSFVCDGREVFHEVNANNDPLGHGTGIVSCMKYSKDIEINMIKIFKEDYVCNCDYLISALEFIYNLSDVYLIHMSLGVRRHDERLRVLCENLHNKGVLMIAAYDNANVMSYPASYDCVIGVQPSYRCLKRTDFVYVNNSPINIKAKPGKQIVLDEPNGLRRTIQMGSSFAAAYVTAEILKHNCFSCKEDVLNHFKNIAVYEYNFAIEKSKLKPFAIKKAAVFPYNKENTSVIRYCDMLNFDIMHVFDIKYSGRVGDRIKSEKEREFIIEDISQCKWEDFDTFILGHVDELSILIQRDLKIEIIEKCLEHGINLYAYDNSGLEKYIDVFHQKNLELFFPQKFDKKESNKFGLLYQHKTPIIAVVGTSKKQGKFTLQIQLRKILEEINTVGQLGTEPNSFLFNFDEMFTFGYASLIDAPIQLVLEEINEKIHEIDLKNKDIIITGSQSSFLPHNAYNCNLVDFNQIAFLYATMPDGVILMCNPQDDINYINRSIQVIEGMIKTKVFMLAIYPFFVESDHIINIKKRKLTPVEIKAVKNKFKNETGLPVIITGETTENSNILHELKEYFQ